MHHFKNMKKNLSLFSHICLHPSITGCLSVMSVSSNCPSTISETICEIKAEISASKSELKIYMQRDYSQGGQYFT
jgi:hypothetical protein